MRRGARAISQCFDLALEPVGLTANQLNVLAALAGTDRPTVSWLAAKLAMDKTTLSRTLKRLKAAGLVVAERSSGRRPGGLMVTPAGAENLRQAIALWREVQTRMTVAIGAGRAGGLLQTVDAIVRAGR
jgi:DNA-binding MarR family transcriptional regulator